MIFYEVNFDGLIGPNHNYSGLAKGNLASSNSAHQTSHPREAALQGLEKMQALLNLGYRQGILLPQQRPDIDVLRHLGFAGTETAILNKVAKQSPELLSMVYSASSMWAANAATVTPSADSGDGRVHFTPANLLTNAHRAIEPRQTQTCLETIFSDANRFVVHSPLPAISRFADEGAANHTRLTNSYGSRGVGLFVYGRDENSSALRFPARQTLEACEAIARQHGLDSNSLFLQQSAQAINGGAFHNDVVAVGNGSVLFYHEHAFEPDSRERVFNQLNEVMNFKPICVPAGQVSLDDAIKSYLFNSQLLGAADGRLDSMTLISPTECLENPAVKAYLDSVVANSSIPIDRVKYVDVRQSMRNGGGPACLRLRVVLNEREIAKVNSSFLLNNTTIECLKEWVKKHYREELSPDDLRDPLLLNECYSALDELTQVLELGNYYPFQIYN